MRFVENPLIRPEEIKATQNGLEVACVLNPAVTKYEDEIIFLMRVAERPMQEQGYISTPVLDQDDQVVIKKFRIDDPLLENEDPRVFKYDGRTYLTTMSHLRIARSKDGINFTVDDKPFVFPSGKDEEYGIEDARITKIGEIYYFYYVAVSHYGVSTILATTKDWKTYEKHDVLFPALNKDVAILPEKINGDYYALTRPDTADFANPSMWIAKSPDMIHWGKHQHLISTRKGFWDSKRIGAGTVPVKTSKGWLEIYHGADDHSRYSLGILLLDIDDPSKVIFRSEKPIMVPENDYETNGFFSEVIFTNGMTYKNNQLYLYYGAADKYICGAKIRIEELLNLCELEPLGV